MPNAQRLRDLGLTVGPFAVGPTNTIVDVPGVRVGHCNLRGASPGGLQIHTGVTAIVPGSGNLFAAPLPVAVDVFNGFGKSAGTVQMLELAQLESPILLCPTLCVGKVWDALAALILEQNPRAVSVNPAVFECNDARFSDGRARPVEPHHVRAALESASTLSPQLGSVGAGSGTSALGFKGGIGSASRLVPTPTLGEVRLGILSYINFGGRLIWRGRTANSPADQDALSGSMILVLATDAPLDPGILRRLARRTWAGIARTGSRFAHGSGDIALAFALPSPDGACPDRLLWRLGEDDLDPLFQAAADATEESVLDALLLAEDTPALNGALVPALKPHQLLATTQFPCA